MAKAKRRDNYADVGASLRTVVDLAATRSLKARDYRVLLGILHHTVSWSKLSDVLTLAQLVNVTGLDRRNVQRALAELHDRGIIHYEPGASPRGEPRTSSRVTLPRPAIPAVHGPPDNPNDQGPDRPPEPAVHRPPEPVRTTSGPGDTDRRSTGHGPAVHGPHDRRSSEPQTGGPRSHPSEETTEETPEKTPEEDPRNSTAAAAVCTACDGSRFIEDQHQPHRWTPCPTCGPDVVLPDDPLTVHSRDSTPVTDLITGWQNGPRRG